MLDLLLAHTERESWKQWHSLSLSGRCCLLFILRIWKSSKTQRKQNTTWNIWSLAGHGCLAFLPTGMGNRRMHSFLGLLCATPQSIRAWGLHLLSLVCVLVAGTGAGQFQARHSQGDNNFHAEKVTCNCLSATAAGLAFSDYNVAISEEIRIKKHYNLSCWKKNVPNQVFLRAVLEILYGRMFMIVWVTIVAHHMSLCIYSCKAGNMNAY
jgi:hypothetical protein